MLEEHGEAALAQAKEQTPELRPVEIRLPKIVFNEGVVVRLGGKTVHVMHAPGPSPDVCVAHVREDKVLFASDLIMPVPLDLFAPGRHRSVQALAGESPRVQP